MSIPGETFVEQVVGVITKKTRESILEEASRIIWGDREKTHGDPGRNLREIATKWSVTFGVEITPAQVAIAMIDLKTVRSLHDPGHRDHWVDIAGYAGLVDRCDLLRE